MWVVYEITRDDGQKYIGKTSSNRIKQRMRSHRNGSIFKDHDFTYRILYECVTHDEVLEAETRLIREYDTYNSGLNKTPTGKGYGHSSPNFSTLGRKYSESSKKKMSEVAIQNNASSRLRRWWNTASAEERDVCISKMSNTKKMRPGRTLLNEDVVKNLLVLYKQKPNIVDVGNVLRNGRVLTYDRAFAHAFANEEVKYPILYKIITGRVPAWSHLL
jgi:predicted GIY-YIG superfamily endonuclease